MAKANEWTRDQQLMALRLYMHAWTKVYLPVLGWRGFDPTIAEETSLKHIPVGVRYHPRGVMPISGMFTGASADYIEMTGPVEK